MYGAYGARLRCSSRIDGTEASLGVTRPSRVFDQLKTAYEALKNIPHSRQVVLQIWDSQRDMPNPRPRSKDVPCNLISHLMIRENQLHWLQVMRSNDFVWGFPYNIIQFTTLQEIVAGWLGVSVGPYLHISDSLHIYQRHWNILEQELPEKSGVPENRADLGVNSYGKWAAILRYLVTSASDLSMYKSPTDLISIARNSESLPHAYREWIAVLTAEALRRRGYYSKGWEVIESAGSFWGTSWKQWAVSARSPSLAMMNEATDNRRNKQTNVEESGLVA